jgi:hypothetical protein
MTIKTHLTTGITARGEFKVLYCGTDGDAAKTAYQKAVSGGVPGLDHAQLFLSLRATRRHDVTTAPAAPPPAAEESGRKKKAA